MQCVQLKLNLSSKKTYIQWLRAQSIIHQIFNLIRQSESETCESGSFTYNSEDWGWRWPSNRQRRAARRCEMQRRGEAACKAHEHEQGWGGVQGRGDEQGRTQQGRGDVRQGNELWMPAKGEEAQRGRCDAIKWRGNKITPVKCWCHGAATGMEGHIFSFLSTSEGGLGGIKIGSNLRELLEKLFYKFP
jgi:hypothetical protein